MTIRTIDDEFNEAINHKELSRDDKERIKADLREKWVQEKSTSGMSIVDQRIRLGYAALYLTTKEERVEYMKYNKEWR